MRCISIPLRRCRRLVPLLALLLLLAAPARAVTVIRDAEIEATLARITDPIFAAARLDPEVIEVYILRDDKLNAFVAGGQNLFINTGLIMRSADPDQLAGVIAHETGHIAGGHLSRTLEARSQATTEGLIGMLLGAAASVVGAPQLGTAIMAGGATVAQRGLLAFSRSQEQTADQAAVSYLTALRMSPRGLLEFFRILETQNLRITTDGSEFLRTHPLTRDRIVFLEQQVADSPYRDAKPSPKLVAAHARAVAKLDGFLSEPAAVLRRRSSDSLPDRYARAIAYYRVPQLDQALALVDGLIADRPEDPYFHELKGQMLFENGRMAEAIAPYRQALRHRPDSALIRYGLARALTEQGHPQDLDEAKALLTEAVRIEPENAGIWRARGIAEGRLGNEGEASLALAEEAVLLRNREDAELHLRRARQRVAPDDPAFYRLQDLERAAEELEEPVPARRR